MLKDITLGQFFPGKSILHRADPRGKLLLLVVFIVALFMARTAWQYAAVATVLLLAIVSAKISLRQLFRGMRPVLFLVMFTAIINIFFTPGEDIAPWFFLRISEEGLRLAAMMMGRILMLISATFLLTYTTSPLQLTDALERAMSPLKIVRFPAHEISMMMTIALRFIPTLVEETDKIMSAQKARGSDFETGGLFKRMRALIPLMVPLILSAFRRANELALAMESRCYNGGKGRTRLRILRWRLLDLALILFVGALLAGVIVMRGQGI